MFALRIIDTTFLELIIPFAELRSVKPLWVNSIGYFTSMFIDILFCLCLVYRASISRAVLSKLNKNYEGIFTTETDIALLTISIMNVIWDILGAAENFIRHLDDIGFSVATAKPYYDWNWIYYHFSDGKTIISGIMFFLLIVMLTNKKHDTPSYSLTSPDNNS